ncbi:MAG: hypothetical protein Q9223_002153 [Gallowayella weberi]
MIGPLIIVSLKPPCVELSQAALRFKVNKTTAKELLRTVDQLSGTLQAVSRSLDAKLADYVFFPLSHIFSESNRLPSRVLERALSCLRLLICQGWKDQLSSEVGKQLLILLSFLAGGSPTESKTAQVDEDVAAIALACITSLFQSSVASSLGSRASVSAENIPLLGHTVTVILDGISNGSATKVCLAACTCLSALITGIGDEEALRNFLPGIVSCLTKVLSPGTRSKVPYKVLHACIQLLDQVLCKIISDDSSSSPLHAHQGTKTDSKGGQTWVEATAGQVKVALSTIMPLRHHDHQEVQEALFSLCISVLSNCRKALNNCTPMLLETLVTLSSHPKPDDGARRSRQLQQVITSDPSLLDLLQDSLYHWTVALPRVVSSNDEHKQRRSLEQLSTAYRLLSDHSIDLKALNDLTASNLQSGVAAAIQVSSTQRVNSVSEGSIEVSRLLQFATSIQGRRSFAPVIFDSKGQGNVMLGIQTLVEQLDNSTMSSALQRSLMESLKSTTGNELIASLWLALQLMARHSLQNLETEQWLNLPVERLDPLAEETYFFSLEILEKSAYDDAVDWRLQALSLEVVASQATTQKQDFRPELVDALYPILERMGSRNAALQQHAVTCLSIVSTACGYSSASELVVDNADYLVNAIAVKLNTFDISPQASQVMLMMVRLCGSTIIPYLDDLIESIFAILGCYHGYPRLVESLFEVLNAVVEEGAKSSPRTIKPAIGMTPTPRQPYKMTAVSDVVNRLQASKRKSEPTSPPPTPPTEPDPPTSPAPESGAPPPSTTEESPPPSKTHSLIHTITQQTSYHLSTPSAPLRRLLLTLIASSLPTLSPLSTTQADKDATFLPLVATLWPHIIRQLFSSSSSTTPTSDLPTLVTTLETLSSLCQFGGSFLLSRVSDLLPSLLTLHSHLENALLYEEKTLGRSRASRSLKCKAWDALVGLVVTVVTYVGITQEMEDGVFEVLGGEALGRAKEGVRTALEGLNPDAVWLLEEGKRFEEDGESEGDNGRWKRPVVEGWDFVWLVF